MTNLLQIEGTIFKDDSGRQVLLRGINVSADSKFPYTPNITSNNPVNFFDGDNVSFVGRPFPLEDADSHLKRLKSWGYNTLRYLYTWEAIESKGPGIYDEEWIESTIRLLRKCKEYGFRVFMDPHQDAWSRFSGGSGAPMWTLYAMGLNPRAFNDTEAALVHNTYPKPEEFPKMIWSTNYQRLACLTMFTMFFGGRDFAPKCIINGKNIQDYLEEHFFNAIKHLVTRVKEAGDLLDVTVIGWESINEPNRGLIGYQQLDAYPKEQQNHKGTSPTAWQAILTGAGRACDVDTYEIGGTGPYKTGTTLIDPKGAQAWLPADYDDSRYGWKRDPGWKLGECVWAQHGVWDPSTDTLLQNNYFSKRPDGADVGGAHEWINIYYKSHWLKFAKVIRSIHDTAILFMQGPVFEIPPVLKGTPDEEKRMVYTPHFYDGITLMTKNWNRYWNVDVLGVIRGRYWSPAFAIKIGETAIRNCFKDQLACMMNEGIENLGEIPCLYSEIGIPYDMNDKAAYKTGDYSSQIRALDANHYALEGSNLNYTIWNYCANNDHIWGDQWNLEDLSLYSLDDRDVSASTPLYSVNDSKYKNQSSTTVNTRPVNESSSSMASSITPSSNTPPRISVAGNRAAEAFIRPAPIKIAGRLIKYEFDLNKVIFEMSIEASKSTDVDAPTEVFVPQLHFPSEMMKVEVSGGKYEYDAESAVLKWWHQEGEQKVKMTGVKAALTEGQANGEVCDQCNIM